MIQRRAKRLWYGVSIAAATISVIGLRVVAYVPQAPSRPRPDSRNTTPSSVLLIPALHTVRTPRPHVPPTRNLFAFVGPLPILRSRTATGADAPNSVTADAPQAMRLIGVASNSDVVDANTTGIVSTNDPLVFVTQGDTVSAYRVERVSSQSILLSDLRTRAVGCLVLGAAAAVPSASACPAVR